MNNKIGTLRYSLITTFLVYLILLPGSYVEATELKTSPSGIDVWRDGIYLGKTPLQIEAEPESTIYLFSNIKTDIFTPYRILRLDSTIIQSTSETYDVLQFISSNLFYDRYGYGKISIPGVHASYPFFFLNNDITQSYSYDLKPPIFDFDIFAPFVIDSYPSINKVSYLYFSPDSKYMVFFEQKKERFDKVFELYLYTILGINPETKFPIFQRLETQHPIGAYPRLGDSTYFSSDSRWLSFCLQDEDSDCQFFIIDLQHPAEEFIPVGKDQKFDECLWQKNGSQIACMWKDHFYIYAAELGNDDRTKISLITDFKIPGSPNHEKLAWNFFYYAGDYLIWNFNTRRDEFFIDKIIVFNVRANKTEVVFNNSRLIMISEDGRYVGTSTNLQFIANQLALSNELKEDLLNEDPKDSGYLFVYQLYDTTTKTTTSKIFHERKDIRFPFGFITKEYVFEKGGTFFSDYLNHLNESVIYPEDLLSLVLKEKSNKYHHPEEITLIQVINDLLKVTQIWRFGAYDKKTQEDIATMFAYYQFPLPGDNDKILIHTLFRFPESGSFE